MSHLLRHWATLYPDKLAVADPSNKGALGLGGPRRLTFAQLNAGVDRLAAHLLSMGFQRGQLAGVQLPHVTEAVLSVLACWRAGLVPAVAPASWRRREITAVFEHLPVEGAIGFWQSRPGMQSHVLTAGGVRQADLCFAFGFGDDVPDGLGNLDECLFNEPPGPREAQAVPSDPPLADQLALVSFGSHRQTGLAIPRSGIELIASGLATAMSLGLSSGDVLLSPYPISGVTGLAGFLLPWLITGSTLILHQPFDLAVYRQQIAAERPSFTAFPAVLLPEIAATGRSPLRAIAPVYAMPPAETAAAPVAPPGVALYVAQNVGELALILRRARGQTAPDPVALPLGRIGAAENSSTPVAFVETRVRGKPLGTASMPLLSGTLCLRGAAVPSLAREWKAFNGEGAPAVDAGGFVHTGIACAVSDAAMTMVTCLRDPGQARHGGIALDIEELDALYSGFPDFLDVAAFTIADPIMGERIFAAVVPPPGESVAESEFRDYLEELDVAPFKLPEKLVVVSQIPRDESGRVQRERILEQI